MDGSSLGWMNPTHRLLASISHYTSRAGATRPRGCLLDEWMPVFGCPLLCGCASRMRLVHFWSARSAHFTTSPSTGVACRLYPWAHRRAMYRPLRRRRHETGVFEVAFGLCDSIAADLARTERVTPAFVLADAHRMVPRCTRSGLCVFSCHYWSWWDL